MADNTRLGFIGLGSMGGAMAPRLLGGGHEVIGFDAVPDLLDAFQVAGGIAVSSVADVGRRSDIVFLSLPTPQAVWEVVLGEAGLRATDARIVVDLSTTGPQMSARIADELAARKVGFVDSPVSGGRAGALKGSLALMAACRQSLWPEVGPLLQTFGKVFYVGEAPGQAQTMKLINNMLSVVALVATSEGLAVGVKAGLDAQTMLDVINASSGRNSATTDKFPRAVLPRSFDFGFATGLSLKDVGLYLDEAHAQGVPSLAGTVAQTMLEIARARFGAKADFTHIARVVEDWSGVEIAAHSTKTS